MNEYIDYSTPNGYIRLKKCENPLCDRLTTAVYCCHQCDLAHERKYEIHENGPLAHSETCNTRADERKDLEKGLMLP